MNETGQLLNIACPSASHYGAATRKQGYTVVDPGFLERGFCCTVVRDYNIDVNSCYPWSVLDLYIGEINVLPIHNFYIIIYDPHAI